MNITESCNLTPYNFRAECADDAQSIRGLLQPWATNWTEVRWVDARDNRAVAHSDVDVEFTVGADAPTLDELRWLVDLIPNCHVAAQTLQPKATYTGERTYAGRWGSPAVQPSRQVLNVAARALDRLEARQRIQTDRTLETRGALKAALAGGARWIEQSADRSGWVVVLKSPQDEELVAVRSICPPLGVRNIKESMQKARIADRVTALGA